jgi:uncharacterized phage protein (TIGR01671 family)
MMREIKLRAWNKAEKKWMHETEVNIEVTHPLYPSTSPLYWHQHGDAKMLGCPDIEAIEQATGLKDKNGKEIYEGDVISYDGNMTGAEGLLPGYILEGVKAIIDFKNGRFYPDRVDKSNEGLDYPKHYEWVLSQIFRAGHTTVIGNIHENPELMSV